MRDDGPARCGAHDCAEAADTPAGTVAYAMTWALNSQVPKTAAMT
ncbi:hypothetical protein [Streptomyces sp. NPDC004008]